MVFEDFTNAMRRNDAVGAKAILEENLRDPDFLRQLADRLKNYTAHPRKFVETFIMLQPEGRQILGRQGTDWSRLVEEAAYQAVCNQGYRVFGTLLQDIENSHDHLGQQGVLNALHKICGAIPNGELVDNFPQVVRETAPYPFYGVALFNIESAVRELCRRDLISHAIDILYTQVNTGRPIDDNTLRVVQNAAYSSQNAETIENAAGLSGGPIQKATLKKFTPL